jgi:myo-inositol-1(or 4)-monophosphatase
LADADGAVAVRDVRLLKDTVREAGELALSLFRTELKNWTKGASSPVSEADIAVNDLLEARLRTATPDYGWLSEESVDDETRLARKLVWIVDPIDGTRGYLAGREDWCVSVALVEDDAPVLAAVFAPVTDEFFFAARGQGATHNTQPISVTGGTALDFARVAGP